jgi:integrase/recombinase XerD
MKRYGNFPALLEAFFTGRLLGERRASPHTVASYRDTFRLLLEYARHRLGRLPSDIRLEDLGAPFLGDFLRHLEKERGLSPRSLNQRLAAIRSFLRFASFQEPGLSAQIERVMAIPFRRFDRRQVTFLSRPEVEAILAAPDTRTWTGRRDHALLTVAVQTGLRVSELTGLRAGDVILGVGAHVRCLGKGRKERSTPLTKQSARVLRAWLREQGEDESAFVFPSARGTRLSRDGVQYVLAKHSASGRKRCASLGAKRVTPHVLRHTTAMALRESGVDLSVIALWLGHESVETTQIYMDADLAMKERIMEKTAVGKRYGGRFQPKDKLLAFLKSL